MSQSIDQLIKALGDAYGPDFGETLAALKAIGEPSVDPLIAVLNDPTPKVRLESASLLGHIAAQHANVLPRVIEALSAALHDPTTGWSAAGALGELAQTYPEVHRRGLTDIVAALGDAEYGALFRISETLLTLGPEVADRLLGALTSSNDRMRAGAATILGFIVQEQPEVGSRILEPLLARLSDSDEDVRANTVITVGLIGANQAFDPLLALLNDPVPVVRARSARALGLLHDERAVEILFAVARDEDSSIDATASEMIRTDAIRGLGFIGTPSTDRLLTLLNTLDANFHGVIMEALGKTQDPRAAAPIAALLRDGDPANHSLAWRGLELLGSHALDVLLTFSLDSVEENTQCTAIRILERIKDERAAGPLVPLLRDSNPVVAGSAVRALQQFGAPVIEPVIELLNDPNPEVRVRAVQVLGGLKDSGAVAPLILMLNDKTPVTPRRQSIASFASKALSLIGTPEAHEAVAQWRTAGGQ